MKALTLATRGERLDVWDDLPQPYEGDPGNFDKFRVVVHAGYNGEDEPVMTVHCAGHAVFSIEVAAWEHQVRSRDWSGEPAYALLVSNDQAVAAFMLHIGMVGDPEGDNAFGTYVAEHGLGQAEQELGELLDDGHAVLAFVERMVEVYRQHNPEV